MFSRTSLLAFPAAAVLAFAGCGSDSDDGAADLGIEDTSADSEAVEDTATETTTEAAPVEESAAGDDAPCGSDLTAQEIDTILGTSLLEMTGSPSNCLLVFADDAIGSYASWSGGTADEALQANLDSFDSGSKGPGTLLDDGRGFIADRTLVVRGDSGMVYSVVLPDNIEIGDVDSAMQALRDLMIVR